jgi:hypothetical protein
VLHHLRSNRATGRSDHEADSVSESDGGVGGGGAEVVQVVARATTPWVEVRG